MTAVAAGLTSARRSASAVAVAPVFVLAPPCTFSWAVCAMLGEHPQLYALPELHLFGSATVGDWWEHCSGASFEMDHGLVRAVAELVFGEQSEEAVVRARGWLRRRAHLTTGFLYELLMERVYPRVPVEKSPTVANVDALQRLRTMFPEARFVHLVSHPRAYEDAVLASLREVDRDGALSKTHWLVLLATDEGGAQAAWLAAHRTIADFLADVPGAQRVLVRGEDLFAGRGDLGGLAEALGVRGDAGAVDAMLHPERSPYARVGPPSAPYGSDAFLRSGPLVRPEWSERWTLEDGIQPRVRELAQTLGYV